MIPKIIFFFQFSEVTLCSYGKSCVHRPLETSIILNATGISRKYIFFSVTTRLRECHRVNLITQRTGISQKFNGLLSRSGASEKIARPFSTQFKLSNFEFSKSVQYIR